MFTLHLLQLIKGDEVILTFACPSIMEREEWTESFRVLNQLALPCDTEQQLSKPLTGKYIHRSVYSQVSILMGQYTHGSVYSQVSLFTGQYTHRSVYSRVSILTGQYTHGSVYSIHHSVEVFFFNSPFHHNLLFYSILTLLALIYRP